MLTGGRTWGVPGTALDRQAFVSLPAAWTCSPGAEPAGRMRPVGTRTLIGITITLPTIVKVEEALLLSFPLPSLILTDGNFVALTGSYVQKPHQVLTPLATHGWWIDAVFVLTKGKQNVQKLMLITPKLPAVCADKYLPIIFRNPAPITLLKPNLHLCPVAIPLIAPAIPAQADSPGKEFDVGARGHRLH